MVNLTLCFWLYMMMFHHLSVGIIVRELVGFFSANRLFTQGIRGHGEMTVIVNWETSVKQVS